MTGASGESWLDLGYLLEGKSRAHGNACSAKEMLTSPEVVGVWIWQTAPVDGVESWETGRLLRGVGWRWRRARGTRSELWTLLFGEEKVQQPGRERKPRGRVQAGPRAAGRPLG